MNTRIIPRFLVPALALVLIVTGVLAGPALKTNAAGNQSWSTSESQENVTVGACDGFDLTTSYSVNRQHHRFTDDIDGLNLERVRVDFAGSLGNSMTGKSYAYDGQFTRWDDHGLNEITITDLQLRFEVGTPGQFTVAFDRLQLDLPDDPAVIVKQFVPHALQMELCYLLADSQIDSAINVVDAVHTENSATAQEEQETPGYSPGCDVIYRHGEPC